MARSFVSLLALAITLTGALPAVAYADPPPWAPAHGWRRQHDPYYTGYTGKQWDRDYGIVSGRCDREAIGSVLGAAAGGAVGSQIGKGSGNAVATVLGAVIGSAIGAQIGKDLDNADRACVGHALELAEEKERVNWTNPRTGAAYVLSPIRGYRQDGRICREFSLQLTMGGRNQTDVAFACQAGEGIWQIAKKEVDSDRPRGRGKGRGRRDGDD